MEESRTLVLQYSSIQPDQKSDTAATFSVASLVCAALPLFGWGMHSTAVIIFSFAFASWFGLLFGITGAVKSQGHSIVAASGVIGALLNGAMAACVVLFFVRIFTHGIC